jgi:hypothetical protein
MPTLGRIKAAKVQRPATAENICQPVAASFIGGKAAVGVGVREGEGGGQSARWNGDDIESTNKSVTELCRRVDGDEIG